MPLDKEVLDPLNTLKLVNKEEFLKLIQFKPHLKSYANITDDFLYGLYDKISPNPSGEAPFGELFVVQTGEHTATPRGVITVPKDIIETNVPEFLGAQTFRTSIGDILEYGCHEFLTLYDPNTENVTLMQQPDHIDTRKSLYGQTFMKDLGYLMVGINMLAPSYISKHFGHLNLE